MSYIECLWNEYAYINFASVWERAGKCLLVPICSYGPELQWPVVNVISKLQQLNTADNTAVLLRQFIIITHAGGSWAIGRVISGICWVICKSAPHPRQPHQHPTTQFFTGRMPFLPPNQRRQSYNINEIHESPKINVLPMELFPNVRLTGP